MNKLTTLFPQGNAYTNAPATNAAGSPAFYRSLEEQALQVLMTGNLEGMYYASAETLAKEALDTLTQISAKDPVFLAKALVYARNEGYLRIAPIVGLIVLSKDRPDLFQEVFDRVILQPGDLQDFQTIARSMHRNGASVRKAMGRWLNNLSGYHVVKYGAPQKKPGTGTPVNMRDILRLSRPKPVDDARSALFSYIIKRIKGEDVAKDLLKKLPEQVVGYERFKDLTSTPELAKKNEDEAVELVVKYDLPYEVVLARLSTPSAWKALAQKAPFMNMLRNLNNYEKNGVFKDKELKAKIISRLTDKEQIAKSKQFPFRFLSAYNAFQGDSDVREALVKAVELSVSNIPDLGRTLVAPDESGSMNSKVSDRSEITMKEIGNLFAAALWKKSASGFMVPFDDNAYPVGYQPLRSRSAWGRSAERVSANKGDSIVSIAKSLAVYNGGTDLSAPVDWALDGGQDFDTAVFITDNVSWYDHVTRGRGVLDRIRKFRTKNPKAQFFFIQMVGYREMQVPAGEPGVHFIYGWSDAVLRYIGNAVAGAGGQVEAVKKVDLKTAYVKVPKTEIHVAGGAKSKGKTTKIGKDGKTTAQRRVLKSSKAKAKRRK